jgi:acylglycerol lipase
MGHSMGGAEVLLLSLLQSQPQPIPPVSGLLLESPYIALHPSAQPTRFTVTAGKLASKIIPKQQLLQKLESKHLCRDQEVCRDWEADDLCHDTGTLQGLAGMLQRAADLTSLANGHTVQAIALKPGFGTNPPGSEPLPVWIGHGTEDRVTSCFLSQAIFDKLDVKDKTLKLYEGAYHKLHAEPDGVAGDFANDVVTWILERTNNAKQEEQGADDVRPKL